MPGTELDEIKSSYPLDKMTVFQVMALKFEGGNNQSHIASKRLREEPVQICLTPKCMFLH